MVTEVVTSTVVLSDWLAHLNELAIYSAASGAAVAFTLSFLGYGIYKNFKLLEGG